jgi:hypothetical protein
MNYKSKYIKYKKKYLKLKGGFSSTTNITNPDIAYHDESKLLTETTKQIDNDNLEIDEAKMLLNTIPEIVIPDIIIPSYKYQSNLITNIYEYYHNYDINVREFEIDLTHFVFRVTKENQKNIITFLGLYYHDCKNPDSNNIHIIKKSLSHKFEEIIHNLESIGHSTAEVEAKLTIINSEEFWSKSNFFYIGKILCNLSENNLAIVELYGLLLKKGYGHIMLCTLLNIFFSNVKFTNLNINLFSATDAVAEKFYTKIGFNCDFFNMCNSNINTLIQYCAGKCDSNIKLILEDDDGYYTDLDDFLSKLI